MVTPTCPILLASDEKTVADDAEANRASSARTAFVADQRPAHTEQEDAARQTANPTASVRDATASTLGATT